MNTKQRGFTLVEVLIVVAVISMLATILVPSIIRVRLLANDALAQNTLKSIAHSLEQYLNDNNQYPANVGQLLNSSPPYLTKDYFTGIHNGYSFTYEILPFSYEVFANPVNTNAGSQTFMISTGAVFTQPPPSGADS